MGVRRSVHARCVVVALVLAVVSSACSAEGGGGGEAAPTTSTITTTTAASNQAPTDASVTSELQGSPPAVVYSQRHPPSRPATTTTTTGAGNGATADATTTTPGSAATTTTFASTTAPPGLPAEHCPEPKTCRSYRFTTGQPVRYPAATDGRPTLEYWINPAGFVPDRIADTEGAVAAAFATWQRAAPALHVIYRGRTNTPTVSGDGINVVGSGENITYFTVKDGRPEFDMRLAPTLVWEPCEQRDGSCTQLEGKGELQSIATHEAGHALSLTHPSEPGEHGDRDRNITMWPDSGRFQTTLALGDVLGIRAVYPCSCPLPPIYDP